MTHLMVGRSAGFVVTQYVCSFILECARTIVMIIRRYKVLVIRQLGWPMFDVVVGNINIWIRRDAYAGLWKHLTVDSTPVNKFR